MVTCAAVEYETPINGRPGNLGDLVWNPKEGCGHVLIAETKCSIWPCGAGCDRSAWTDWDHVYAMCECGGYEPCDHHNELIGRINLTNGQRVA